MKKKEVIAKCRALPIMAPCPNSVHSAEKLHCTYVVHTLHYLKHLHQIPSQSPSFQCINSWVPAKEKLRAFPSKIFSVVSSSDDYGD